LLFRKRRDQAASSHFLHPVFFKKQGAQFFLGSQTDPGFQNKNIGCRLTWRLGADRFSKMKNNKRMATYKGTIHKQCWQFFRIFDTPLPHVGSFLVQSDKNLDQFLTITPFLISDIVYGQPLII
jgi:hypothetical protein